MTTLQTKFPTDTWVVATWAEFLQAIEDPACEKAASYYYNGQARMEMSPVGPDHSHDNGIIALLVNLFGMAKAIPMRAMVNCSYRQTGIREAQPDLSYYIGQRVQLAPRGSSVVNLDRESPPDLAIEIAASSLADDLGSKRMLYEELGVAEYWVVDVERGQLIAFKITANRGSERITESQILPGLEISLLESGLQRSRDLDNTEVGNWFLTQISGSR